MELQAPLRQLADKIQLLKEKIETEESTKHAFVLPFINALGYDTFNPLEVVPEYVADLGIKKGEKVDYAIIQDGDPILIIECKHWKEKLSVHGSQLFRYFHVSKTRFALLTNGIQYQFFTDLDEKNKMDERPFLEFDITNLRDAMIHEIGKFHKSSFDVNKILDNASALKYIKEIRKQIDAEVENPSPEFVRLFASRIHSGRMTEKVMDEFKELVQKAFGQLIGERINERLHSALNQEVILQEKDQLDEPEATKVNTTAEEMEGFRIVVAILRRKLPITRIVHRDTQSYFGILLDDNNRKPICRLHFNGGKKYIGLFDADKNEQRHLIQTVEDIYGFEEALLETIKQYE
jgi:hypothetical protein